MIGYLYLGFMVAFVALGQYFIKSGTADMPKGSLRLKDFFIKKIILGCLAVGFAPMFYILALMHFTLSAAYMVTSINIVIISFIGYFTFGERFSRRKILGIILIIFGVIIYSINENPF